MVNIINKSILKINSNIFTKIPRIASKRLKFREIFFLKSCVTFTTTDMIHEIELKCCIYSDRMAIIVNYFGKILAISAYLIDKNFFGSLLVSFLPVLQNKKYIF